MADNPEDDFLESSTADPSMTLGEAAYATGAIGSSFAPGAGVADVLGYAPDPFNPGQMLPSFSENVDQGNYIDAGIQTLGLAGDAFYAAAPFTAGIAALPGGVLKGAQALAKTLRGGSIPNPKTTTPQVFFPDLGEKSHVTLQPDVKNDAVSIMYIEADKPGQGQGGEMLRRVTEQADATGTRLTLYPDPRGEGGLDQDELIEFYQRNGFEFKYPDPDNPDPILDMVREPRPTAQSSTLYRSEATSYENPNEGAVFYTPDKSYAELYASGDRVLRETSLPANVFDIREPGNSEAVLNWVDRKVSNLEDISGVSVDIRDVYAGIEQGGPQGASRALAAYNTILAKQADRSIIPGRAEKMFMQDFGIDAMTIKEAGRDLDEYSVAFKDAPRPTDLKQKYDEFFKNMGEEGAGMEFPAIGQAVDSYVTDFDPRTSFDLLDVALKSDDYPEYATVLRANLDRLFPGDKISVSRTENYSDPYAGIEGRRSKSFFEVDKDDVLFAGGESERELIIRGPSGPMSVRVEDPGVAKKAEGGVISLVDIARNMNRGPRGVGSLAPVARNMYRTMVS
tara:strand:- start:31 stop:1728 length:1698 start_codon:yes stop_codon:yes gene_type:complete